LPNSSARSAHIADVSACSCVPRVQIVKCLLRLPLISKFGFFIQSGTASARATSSAGISVGDSAVTSNFCRAISTAFFSISFIFSANAICASVP
jgi:hypothetical protein